MLGIICGLKSEAALASMIAGSVVENSGSNTEQARARADSLILRGATRLMSFGVAGGLDTNLPAGALVLGSHVVTETTSHKCSADWNNELLQQLQNVQSGKVFGSDYLITTAQRKKEIYNLSGALVVDMESHAVASVATRANVPFTVVRTVCDAANVDMPQSFLKAIKPDGDIDILRVLLGVLSKPGELPALISTGRGFGKGMNSLRRAAFALR